MAARMTENRSAMVDDDTIERTLSWQLMSYAQYRVLADWTHGTGYHKKRANLLAKAIDEFATKWLLDN